MRCDPVFLNYLLVYNIHLVGVRKKFSSEIVVAAVGYLSDKSFVAL